MTNQEEVIAYLGLWRLNHDFIKQIWIIHHTENTLELVFKIIPYGKFDDEGKTWVNYGPNFLQELSREPLLGPAIKVFRYNDPKFPNETKKANESGTPVILPPFKIVD